MKPEQFEKAIPIAAEIKKINGLKQDVHLGVISESFHSDYLNDGIRKSIKDIISNELDAALNYFTEQLEHI
jgi:hypothetical protein